MKRVSIGLHMSTAVAAATQSVAGLATSKGMANLAQNVTIDPTDLQKVKKAYDDKIKQVSAWKGENSQSILGQLKVGAAAIEKQMQEHASAQNGHATHVHNDANDARQQHERTTA